MSETANARASGEAVVRPGAMTHAMRAAAREPRPSARVLRWALVRDARIVTEAVVHADGALTVGERGDVPCRGLPAQPLAWHEDGRWRLRVSSAWSGRLGERALEPSSDGTWIELALEDDARGRLVIGEHALLLQVIDPPPERARPRLPAAVTGGLLGQVDWLFTSFVVASFLLHFSFVVGLIEADWPVETELIPARFAEPIFLTRDEPDPEAIPEEPMLADAQEQMDDSSAPPSEASTSSPPARSGEPARRRTPSADANLAAREAAATAANLLIAGLRADRQGAMRDLLENGGPTGDARSLLEGVEGAEVASGPPGMLDERPGGDCAGCDDDRSLGRLARSGNGGRALSEGAPVREVVITVAPQSPDPIDPIPPGFDTRELVRALRARMPAVQRCYEHELTRGNPDAEGRLAIGLTVMPVGSLANVRAAENQTGSEALAACTIRNLRTVRVRVGPTEPIEFEYPIVFRRPG